MSNMSFVRLCVEMSYSGSSVFIPSGPSSFFSATSKAFQALSTVNSSGAFKNRHIMSTNHSSAMQALATLKIWSLYM